MPNDTWMVKGLKNTYVYEFADQDDDGIADGADMCPAISGKPEFQGCPNAISIPGDLHVIYSGKDSGYAGMENGKQKNSIKIPLKPGAIGDSRGEIVDSVKAKVYTLSALQTKLGTKDFDKNLKDQCTSIFDSTTGVNSQDLTAGSVLVGVPAVDNYVLAARVQISDPIDNIARTATVCRKIDSGKFDKDYNGIKKIVAEQKLKFMKTVKNNCDSKDPKKICVQFDPGDETVLTGSMLSITAPEEARWEEGVTNYIYPYVFESDSDWTLDVCTYAPAGYKVTGVYDENGVFTTSKDCTQTLVNGAMKVVAFEIVDVGSPKVFDVSTNFTIKHKGSTQKIEKKISSKVKSTKELKKTMVHTSATDQKGWNDFKVKASAANVDNSGQESDQGLIERIGNFLGNLF